MGKRETKESYKDTKAERAQSEAKYESAMGESEARSDAMEGGMGDLRGSLIGGYQGLGSAGSVTPERVSAPQISNAGNVDLGRLNETYDRYKNLGPAYSDEQRASIGQDVQGMKDIGATGATDVNRARGLGGFEQLVNEGGLSQDDINRMRGNGVWDEFATTGGYSPEARANIKAQAISPIGSYATGTRDELQRRLALTGGYGPGFDAANRALQRDTSRAIADTSLNANVAIQDRVNQGRLAGVGGLTSAEQNLQNLRTGNIATGAAGAAQSENAITQNRLQGLTGASQTAMGLQDRINQYTLAGLSGQEATARAIADVEGGNLNRQNQVGMFNAGTQANSDQFNAGNSMDAQRFNISNAQGQQQAGLAGMGGIYNSDVGQYQNELDRRNALLGGQTQSNLGYLNNQTQIGMQPGIGGNIMNAVGSAAGIGASLLPVRAPKPMYGPAY